LVQKIISEEKLEFSNSIDGSYNYQYYMPDSENEEEIMPSLDVENKGDITVVNKLDKVYIKGVVEDNYYNVVIEYSRFDKRIQVFLQNYMLGKEGSGSIFDTYQNPKIPLSEYQNISAIVDNLIGQLN
jgi:hypothetical protein